MIRTSIRLSVCLSLICCALLPLMAQSAASADNVVPGMVKFAVTLNDSNGKPLTGTAGVTFLLYKEQSGGAPLWTEIQNVQTDKNGHYSVMLGSTTSRGIPSDAFAAGQARCRVLTDRVDRRGGLLVALRECAHRSIFPESFIETCRLSTFNLLLVRAITAVLGLCCTSHGCQDVTWVVTSSRQQPQRRSGCDGGHSTRRYA